MSYVYLIGIGGAGMSALARYYQLKGCNVSGYDRSHNMYTDELEQLGIVIHYDSDAAWLESAPMTPDNTLVIYTLLYRTTTLSCAIYVVITSVS